MTAYITQFTIGFDKKDHIIYQWSFIFFHSLAAAMYITLTAISIDRFCAISKPIQYRKAKKTYTIILIYACWIAGFVKNWLLRSLKFYKMLMPFHMISFVTFFSIYGLIYIKMRKISPQRTISDESVIIREIKMTKTIGLVVLTYVAFVMPFFISELSAPFENSSKKMRYLGRFLLLCNCVANPFIYCFRVEYVTERIKKRFKFDSSSGSTGSEITNNWH